MANLVVLSGDLFFVAREKIGEVTPSAVLFEGELVSGALELPRR